MRQIFEARSLNRTEDFASKDAARRWVEAAGSGQVVTFIAASGPFDHDRSCALEVFENGTWRACNIHG